MYSYYCRVLISLLFGYLIKVIYIFKGRKDDKNSFVKKVICSKGRMN